VKPAHAVVLGLGLALSGCGLVEDFNHMQQQSEGLAVMLEQQVGVKPVVSWSVRNGVLERMDVMFPADQVAGYTTAELESHVRALVFRRFDPPPRLLTVSVQSAPGPGPAPPETKSSRPSAS
jgi:hypothetical protein